MGMPLCLVAELLGKEAAVFLPSGTMCNEIAMRVHCRPGDEMLAHRTEHPIHFETGGPAALAGVNVRALDGARGQFDAAAVDEAVRPDNRYFPRSRLLWVEALRRHPAARGQRWSSRVIKRPAMTSESRLPRPSGASTVPEVQAS